MMPGLPGSDFERDLKAFHHCFQILSLDQTCSRCIPAKFWKILHCMNIQEGEYTLILKKI